jgi:hypothetical protein
MDFLLELKEVKKEFNNNQNYLNAIKEKLILIALING